MACASPTLALCGGRYRAAIVPVAKGTYVKIVVADDIVAGRLVALKVQRATSAEAVREHRFFRAIRAAQDIGRAGDGGRCVVRLIDDFTEDCDQAWMFSHDAKPTLKKKKQCCSFEVIAHGFRISGFYSGAEVSLSDGASWTFAAFAYGWARLLWDCHSATLPT